MKFKTFVSSGHLTVPSWFKNTRIISVVKGEEVARAYVLRLLEERLPYEQKSIYFLRELKDTMLPFLSSTENNMRILFWEDKLFKDKEVETFLFNALTMNGCTIIVDGSRQIHTVQKDVQRKNRKHFHFIECLPPVDTKDGNMESWMGNWLSYVENLQPSLQMTKYFLNMPFVDVFNLLNAIRALGIKSFNVSSVRYWGILQADQERVLVNRLLYRGSGYAKQGDWKDINTQRFFWLLFKELVDLLRYKTASQGYATVRVEKIGVSLDKYYMFSAMEKKKKFSISELYRQLGLVTRLIKWRNHKDSVSLLLFYW